MRVNASHFDADTKTITVELHAGNKANVLEHNVENNDDFTVKNIRMVLPSGKTLYPTSYEAKKGPGRCGTPQPGWSGKRAHDGGRSGNQH